MSNYSLVVNSTFQPFTYQELAAPLDRQELYHEKIADEYDKLSSQADVLEAMGANDRDRNSKTYLKYKNYSDNLRKEADNLYQNGLNYDTRQRLSNLRRMYNTDIVPIQNAWNKREQEADMQMKASMQNPSLMFTRDARNSTLDEYIANPTGGFGVINGNNITAQMASMANNLKEQIRKGDKTNIDDYTYNYIVQHGLDENIIRDWRNSPTLSKMFEQVMRANGVTPEALNGSANAQSIIDQSTGYAEMGMWNAIGKDTNNIVENFKTRQDYQFALNERAAQNAAIRAAEAANDNGFNGTMDDSTYQLPMQGADFSHAGEQEKAMQKLGYQMKDGKLVYTGKTSVKYDLDKAEVEEYNRQKREEMNELGRKVRSGKASEAEVSRFNSMQRMLGRYGNFKSSSFSGTSKEVSLYNNDGTLMSRKQFVAQAGGSENLKKALDKYYDDIEKSNQTLGISGGYSHRDLTKHYNTLRDNNAAQMASVRALNYEKGDWNPTSKNYTVREIKNYKNGKPIYDTKAISLGELLDKKNSNQQDISVASYWSNVNGQEGLILATTEDGKPHRYFISADSMPESNVRTARQYFNLAEQYKQRGRSSEAMQATEIAMRALHTGLTIHNKAYDQDMVRQPSLKQQGLVEE